jgi:hypothetical protein
MLFLVIARVRADAIEFGVAKREVEKGRELMGFEAVEELVVILLVEEASHGLLRVETRDVEIVERQ